MKKLLFYFLFFTTIISAQVYVTVPNLPPADSLKGTGLFIFERAGTTYKLSYDSLQDAFDDSLAAWLLPGSKVTISRSGKQYTINIATGTITANDLVDGTVTGNKIYNYTISGGSGGNLALGTVDRNNMHADAVDSTVVKDSSLLFSDLRPSEFLSFSAAKIAEKISNGGAPGATKWVDSNSDGLADNFTTTGDGYKVAHYEGFNGVVQQFDTTNTHTSTYYITPVSVALVAGNRYRIILKHFNYSTFTPWISSTNQGVSFGTQIESPELDTVVFTALNSGNLYFRTSKFCAIDELSVKNITGYELSYTDNIPDTLPKALGQVLVDFKDRVYTAISLIQKPYWKPLNVWDKYDYESYDKIRQTIIVDKGGAGNYTSLKPALESITDSRYDNQYLVIVNNGVYTDTNMYVPPYVHITGRDKSRCIFKKAAGGANIFNLYRSSKLSNMTLLSTSGAGYCVHIETRFGNPFGVNVLDNVSMSTTAAFALGMGTDEGQHIIFKNCFFETQDSSTSYRAVSIHDQNGEEFPSTVVFDGCSFSSASGEDLSVQGLGSAEMNRLILNNNSINKLNLSGTSWYTIDSTLQFANRRGWDITGGGNTDFAFASDLRGTALKISSNTTGISSSVSVSGDAVWSIMGDSVTVSAGAVGLSGYAIGNRDITAELHGTGSATDSITALGKRLGNCTGVNKTLVVTADGGSAQTVTFNQDYRYQSNATIISAINAALTGAAAKQDTINFRYYPEFFVKGFKNYTATALLKGTVVRYANAANNIMVMDSSTNTDLYAGVVLLDSPSGSTTKIIINKTLNTSWIRIDSTPAFGDKYGVLNGVFTKNILPTIAIALSSTRLKVIK